MQNTELNALLSRAHQDHTTIYSALAQMRETDPEWGDSHPVLYAAMQASASAISMHVQALYTVQAVLAETLAPSQRGV